MKPRRSWRQLKTEQMAVLEHIAGLPREEARQLLIAQVESEVKSDIERRVRDMEAEAKLESERRAHKIIGLAIQRCAADVVAETTVSVVNLPNEEMKGRIIGREGRNIRALEAATGIDLIIDDTPEAVILSGFDPVRREVARVALTKLIADGRIHPARIEEVVTKARAEVDVAIREAGRASRLRRGCAQSPPRPGQAARPSEVPHQLWAERAQPRGRSSYSLRGDGRGGRPPIPISARRPACSTISAKRSTMRSKGHMP